MDAFQLRAARAMLGITQHELANAAGVSAATIVAFEARKRTPHRLMRERLQQVLEERGVRFFAGGIIMASAAAMIAAGKITVADLLAAGRGASPNIKPLTREVTS